MKNLRLLLLLLFPLPVWANVSENDSEDTWSFVAGRSFVAVFTFSYDTAGNVTSKSCFPYLTQINPTETEQNSLVNERGVSITADDSWSNVSINVLNNSGTNDPILNIYNISGINGFSGRIGDSGITINLSILPCGVYLFQFIINGEKRTYKLIKH